MYRFDISFFGNDGLYYSFTPYTSGNGYTASSHDLDTGEHREWHGCEKFPAFLYNKCASGTEHTIATCNGPNLISSKSACKVLKFFIDRTQVY